MVALHWDGKLRCRVEKRPRSDDLSRAEDRIIETVFEQYKDHDKWELVDTVHRLPEWEAPGETSKEISYETVLQVEGLPEEAIADILDNISAQTDTTLVLGTR